MANDHAQSPNIDEIFRHIGNKVYHMTLYMSNAFWQIPLDEEPKKYTGFLFNNQIYVFDKCLLVSRQQELHLRKL